MFPKAEGVGFELPPPPKAEVEVEPKAEVGCGLPKADEFEFEPKAEGEEEPKALVEPKAEVVVVEVVVVEVVVVGVDGVVVAVLDSLDFLAFFVETILNLVLRKM